MVSTQSSIKKEPRVGILTGPTATGKTSIALEFASRQGNIEIINADSMLVYRGMDIGTAKPTQEERQKVTHHLIDIRDPHEPFTAGDFTRAALEAIHDVHARGKRALIVGGTGFYLKSLLFGIWEAPAADLALRKELDQLASDELYLQLQQHDPASAQRIGSADRYRLIRSLELIRLTGKTPSELQSDIPQNPNPQFFLCIIDRTNEDLHEIIRKRTEQMLSAGIIEEFKSVQARHPESRALSAVGYAQVSSYLQGVLPRGRKMKSGIEGLSEEIQLATRQLVKSQRTWFRGQSSRVPQSKWFQLERDRSLLEEDLKSVYEVK